MIGTRLVILAAVVAVHGLHGQSTVLPEPRTVIHDPAWSGSAAGLELTRARANPVTARLANVSIRAQAGAGSDTLIAGAAIQGTGALPVVVRAVGPGLRQFGVAGALSDPELEIYRSGLMAAQTNMAGPAMAAASAYVGAFPLSPGAGAGDAGLVGQAVAGTLTAHCRSASGGAGVALLEFYDASAVPAESTPRFVNFSSRARVGAGDGLVVVGFVVAGEGSVTLLLRGVGATLQQFGVAGTLANPTIELFANGARVAANDNWGSADAAALRRLEEARAAVGAFALSSPNDAALVVTLPAGAYTLQLSGVGGQTGVALAEIHEVSRGEFDAATATNAVGLDVYRELARTKPGENLIVSPYSIESALALAYAGAEGLTREEMARVLRFPAETERVQAGFAELRVALARTAEASRAVAAARPREGGTADPIEWTAANRLFGQRGYAFRESFLTLMRDGFAAPLELLDFQFRTEPARVAINSWVEDQTRQRIRNLIPQGGVTTDTRLVLVNALYLKAPWDAPFARTATAPRDFRLATGGVREVPTMQRTATLGHAVDEGFTLVTLDYLGGELQCVIALPDEGQSIEAAAARVTAGHLARWARLADAGRKPVALYLPRFRVEGATVPLGQALRALGMRSAFDEPRGSANFDRIAPRSPTEYLAVSDVFHQTFVALDEEGTEAAAATAVVIGVVTVAPNPPPAIEVRVDRPFLFAIQHRASGVCLFYGRITDPR